VNSIRSFTRSFQRAAGFVEVIPQRPAFVYAFDQAPIGAPEAIQYGRSDVAQAGVRTSLLRQHLEASPPNATFDEPDSLARQDPGSRAESPHAADKTPDEDAGRAFHVGSPATRSSIFAIPPYLATPPLFGSYASYRTGYGTMGGAVDETISPPTAAEAEARWLQQQESGGNVPDDELPPILVKEIEEDGKIILTVAGQSTLPQTIFNSIK
jgi:solute carrier family 32 (vesicular inhibitory amino acid transporter)